MKKQDKDEKLEGHAEVNKFFRDIYSIADEDMRRAMSKSFVSIYLSTSSLWSFFVTGDYKSFCSLLFEQVESNGTVLSTSWKEVGAKTIESTPPDGMELKKWEI